MNKNDIFLGAQKLAQNGVSGEDIGRWLESKGSSNNELRGIMQYGANNVEKAQNAVKDVAQEQEKNRPSLAMEMAKAAPDAFLTAAEIPVNAATLGAYNWANEKLGGTANERKAEMEDAVMQEMPRYARNIYRIGNLAAEIGGSGVSPIVRAIPMSTSEKLWKQILSSVGVGAGMSGVRSAFDTDFDMDKIAKSAALGGAIGGAVPMIAAGYKNLSNYVKDYKAANKPITKEQFIDYISENPNNPKVEKNLNILSKSKYGEDVNNFAYDLQTKLNELAKKNNQLGLKQIPNEDLDALLGNKLYRELSEKYGNLITPQIDKVVLNPSARASFLEQNPYLRTPVNPVNIAPKNPGTIRELDFMKQQANMDIPKITDIETYQSLINSKGKIKDIIEDYVPGLKDVSQEMNTAATASRSTYPRTMGIIRRLSGQAISPTQTGIIDLGAGSAALGGAIGGSPTTVATGLSMLASKGILGKIRAGAVKNAITETTTDGINPETVNNILKAIGQQSGKQ